MMMKNSLYPYRLTMLRHVCHSRPMRLPLSSLLLFDVRRGFTRSHQPITRSHWTVMSTREEHTEMAENRIRVVSWNVNGIRARWPRLVQLCDAQQPDVVCLQEARCPDNRFPYGQLRDLGYEAQHSCGVGGAGVAILVGADHEVDRRSLALDHDHDMAAGRWLQVTLDGLTISSVYVPAGSLEQESDAEAKLAFLE